MADFDIGSILSSLSAEDMENLKNTASQLLGGSVNAPQLNGAEDKSKREKPPAADGIAEIMGGLGMPDLSQLSALLPVFNALNTQDERLDFINALKPLISETKRKKADEAMKLIRLLSLLPLLRERGIM